MASASRKSFFCPFEYGRTYFADRLYLYLFDPGIFGKPVEFAEQLIEAGDGDATANER